MYNSLLSFLEWKQRRRGTNQHLIYHCIPTNSEVMGMRYVQSDQISDFFNVIFIPISYFSIDTDFYL